ncbi:MAG: SDR family NAD(P)-dependent oxidoreductase, partial [Caulobacterales bacterium]
MDIRFDGRVAIVTGAGRGQGRQYAMDLAARGAKVVVNDLGGSVDGYGADPEIAPKVVEEIRSLGGVAVANVSDVRTPDGASEILESALAAFGGVDILVNNAGIARDRTILEMSTTDFVDMISTHVVGAFNCTKAVWPSMAERQYGRVVMVSSDSGIYGMFNQANYSAAKAAMLGLMHALAIEGRTVNINVNAIAPQAMTRMSEGYEVEPKMKAALDPKWPSAAMLFLCAEETKLT